MVAFEIEIAFAPDSQTQLLKKLHIIEGTTAKQAVEHSQLLNLYPQILDYDIGIFSQKINWDKVLTVGDRLEIYRPLTLDPMKKRLQKLKKS